VLTHEKNHMRQRGCAKPKVKPTMSQNNTGQYLPGKFVWFNLYTDMTVAADRNLAGYL